MSTRSKKQPRSAKAGRRKNKVAPREIVVYQNAPPAYDLGDGKLALIDPTRVRVGYPERDMKGPLPQTLADLMRDFGILRALALDPLYAREVGEDGQILWRLALDANGNPLYPQWDWTKAEVEEVTLEHDLDVAPESLDARLGLLPANLG